MASLWNFHGTRQLAGEKLTDWEGCFAVSFIKRAFSAHDSVIRSRRVPVPYSRLRFPSVFMLFGFAAVTVPAFPSSDYFHRHHANVRFHACFRLYH